MLEDAYYIVRTLTEDCEIEAELGIWDDDFEKGWTKFSDYERVAINNSKKFGWIATVELIDKNGNVLAESYIDYANRD